MEINVLELLCTCGCTLKEHYFTNRGCKKTRALGTRHCGGFALATLEIDKVAKIADKSQEIGAFLEWLREQRIHLAQYHRHNDECPHDRAGRLACDVSENVLWSFSYTPERLIAQYFDIDLLKFDREKMEALEVYRYFNEPASTRRNYGEKVTSNG